MPSSCHCYYVKNKKTRNKRSTWLVFLVSSGQQEERKMQPYEEDDKVPMEQEQPYADGASFKSSMFDSVTAFEVLMVEEFSDLNLVIGSHIIAVHQLVLASHSQLLAGGGASKISSFV